MVTRIYLAEEPKAVELEDLENGGVVAVFTTRHDFDEFVKKIAHSAFTFLNDNTDTFDPTIVQMMIEDALESKKDEAGWSRLLKLEPADIEEYSRLATEGTNPKMFDTEDDGPQTREEWIENNKSIASQEGDTDLFTVEIETRLGLAPELRTEADEALGAAYVGALANYESQKDQEYYHERGEAEPWAPLTAAYLASEYGITPEEANAVVKIAALEYEDKVTGRPD